MKLLNHQIDRLLSWKRIANLMVIEIETQPSPCLTFSTVNLTMDIGFKPYRLRVDLSGNIIRDRAPEQILGSRSCKQSLKADYKH